MCLFLPPSFCTLLSDLDVSLRKLLNDRHHCPSFSLSRGSTYSPGTDIVALEMSRVKKASKVTYHDAAEMNMNVPIPQCDAERMAGVRLSQNT